ncbi:MAG TPA: L,D-transpeptidase [Acidimicrobiales bacterium]|nr:L,D-transpeptidase [Acidimicrobiales bacterium]
MRRPGVWRIALVAAVVALAVGVGSWILVAPHPPGEGGMGREAAAAPSFSGASSPAPVPQPVQAAPTVTPTLIATLSAQTPYSSQPGGPPVGTLPALNPFGAQNVLALIGQPDASGWAQAELPIRPNGSVGYIQTGDGSGVSLTETTYSVKISLASDTLTVMNGNDVVMTVPAAVGASKTPTPPDHTYLWELIRPDNPNGAYGPYIFGLGEFSDAYSVFNGGDAQIGIHGQDEPSSVGHPVSHGCVRLDNGVITQLAGTLPLGTPVTIS